jgi:hypothetical protein
MGYENIGWLVGRKNICRYLGVVDWRTVKKMMEKYDLPILKLRAGPPKALRAELDNWLSSFRERVKEIDKNEKRKK